MDMFRNATGAVDGEGTIRHIARETEAASIISRGISRPITFKDCFKCIVASLKADPVLKLNIIDTVLLERRDVQSYTYTDSDGMVCQKPTALQNLKSVHNEFMNIARTLQGQDQKNVALCYKYGNSSPIVLNADDFEAFCYDLVTAPSFSPEIEILQCFVPSKGSETHHRTYRTTFWLDKTSSAPQMKTDRLDISTTITGSDGIRSKQNMSRQANKTMESSAQQLIYMIEKMRHCRVARACIDFVQDYDGKIWLQCVSECIIVTSNEEPNKRASSPAELKVARAMQLAEAQRILRAERENQEAAALLGPGAASQTLPNVTNGRRRLLSLDKAQSMSRSATSAELLMRPRPGSRKGRPGTGGTGGGTTARADSTSPSRVEVPEARLGEEAGAVADLTALLGSSQLTGLCPGDFCSHKTETLELAVAGETSSSSIDHLSNFRRKLMLSHAEVDAGEGAGLAATTAGMGSVVGVGSDGFGGTVAQMRRQVTRSRHSRSRGDDGDAARGDDRARTLPLKISYRSILQARQEMPLVKMQLARHRLGEAGDYVTQEGQISAEDVAELSGKMAPLYYQEVPVCANCHNVYMIIDDARQKALKKLEARKAKLTSPKKQLQQQQQQHRQQRHRRQDGDATAVADSVQLSRSAPLSFSDAVAQVDSQAAEDSLRAAVEAIDGLTKADVAEMRALVNPPAAVEVVLEAVMALLTGRFMAFQDARRLLSGGEAFLLMLQQFRVEDVTDERLRLAEAYADNPLFRPKHVQPVSLCAAKFCAWVLGVVQAARWHRGLGHRRTDPVPAKQNGDNEDVPFHLKLAREKAKRQRAQRDKDIEGEAVDDAGTGKKSGKGQQQQQQPPQGCHGPSSGYGRSLSPPSAGLTVIRSKLAAPQLPPMQTLAQSHFQSSLPKRPTRSASPTRGKNHTGSGESGDDGEQGSKVMKSTSTKQSRRQKNALVASQRKAAERLTSYNAISVAGGTAQEFRCADGLTVMPYVVMGSLSAQPVRCNFVVAHDFFDTADATALLLKNVTAQHPGCQALCFNYPGQANTVWPRPPAAERDRGAVGPIHNNDWIADRLHELLQFVEMQGDFLLSNPFHLVGFGNGANIAAAFCQRWGSHPSYADSLRSLVSVNGFLQTDPQLAAVLHSAADLFENTAHSRPDIPVSFWSRFVFSEDYLSRVSPNLALNIYTAVSNPITNEGRAKIARGALQHRDLRGGLAPDLPDRNVVATVSGTGTPAGAAGGGGSGSTGKGEVISSVLHLSPVQVPLVLLQSTENMLVGAANVDPFLAGRGAKHLWSHQLNAPSTSALVQAQDPTAHWVGKLSSGPHDYPKFSTLGKAGLRMLVDVLGNARGAFVMWVRTGHAVQQESKGTLLDLLDALALPAEDRLGLGPSVAGEVPGVVPPFKAKGAGSSLGEQDRLAIARSLPPPLVDLQEVQSVTAKVEVMFKLNPPPKKVVETGRTLGMGQDGRGGNEDEEPLAAEAVAEANDDGPLRRVQFDDGEPAADSSDLSIEKVGGISVAGNSDENDATGGAASQPRGHGSESLDGVGTAVEPAVRPTSSSSSPAGAAVPPTAVRLGSGIEPVVMSPGPMRPDLPTVASHLGETAEAASQLRQSSTAPSLRVDGPLYTMTARVDGTPHDPEPGGNERDGDDGRLEDAGRLATLLSMNTHEPEPGDQRQSRPWRTDELEPSVASGKQRDRREWTDAVPSGPAAAALEADLARRQREFMDLEAQIRERRAQEAAARLTRLEEEQALRRQQYEDEDKILLEKLQLELETRRREREAADRQRRLQIQAIEQVLVEGGLVPPAASAAATTSNKGSTVLPALAPSTTAVPPTDPPTVLTSGRGRDPVKELPPMNYSDALAGGGGVPAVVDAQDAAGQLDRMAALEEEARKKGTMTLEDYELVRKQMAQRQIERDHRLMSLVGAGQDELFAGSAQDIQRVGRGYLGRRRARALAVLRAQQRALARGVTRMQAVLRGAQSRRRTRERRRIAMLDARRGSSAVKLQACFRGFVSRKYARMVRRFVNARHIQRCFRGFLGRQAASRERARLALIQAKHRAAARIQAAWRMKVAKEEFRSLRIHMLAALEIQRCFRGFVGRKLVARRRKWEAAAPGPERIKLGLQLIEEGKAAFERQQEEIDALHRAQERAEARVSFIHAELKDSEQELVVLERELQEIDQIERDLVTLTHERNVLTSGISDAAGLPRTAARGSEALVLGQESTPLNDPDIERRKKAEAYALEMTIQVKRAEREKKRQELETEFSSVFQEVDKKKKALERLELSLADMEATRERKDREFRRLQKNLMQLLLEQKQELDELREKGIELETATAVTAAAATATALKAKEHEKRSTVMFSQTEELMKFQFMSMSLSYFSSLNMLKQLRDMNADTTSAAVAASADAAASSAAAAAAANLPSVKRLEMGAADFVDQSVQKKRAELEASEAAEKEIKKAKEYPLPEHVRNWSVADVGRWLQAMSLGQYVTAFRDATVDGPFLLELREEDMVQVLGISHKLHVRKILVSREKLKPLSEQERAMKEVVEREDRSDQTRGGGPPDVYTVFSQARNGRIKRVEESLNLGFPVDGEDEKGNTLLLVACQNNNKRLVEVLLLRGASINHQNAQGNTALHFALTFDPEGLLGEYLIERGADDSIENVDGLTAYDGVGGER